MANLCSSNCGEMSHFSSPSLESGAETAMLAIDNNFQRLAIHGQRVVDNHSEWWSSDRGQGSSEVATQDSTNALPAPWPVSPAFNPFTAYSDAMGAVLPSRSMIYEFEIPHVIVGRLIGKHGSFVNRIKLDTGAKVIVKRHHNNTAMQICAVEGLCAEIENAIGMIREQFPLKRYPFLGLEQLNYQSRIPAPTAISFLPPNNRLKLIEGVVNDVRISNIVNVNHIFVQQPTHPTYPSLSRLHQALMSVYEQGAGAPELIRPFYVGLICVTRFRGGWYRAEVVTLHDDNEKVTIRLVDIGGYREVRIEALRQIRRDFVTIPFQSTECKLIGVNLFTEENVMTDQARLYFDTICQSPDFQAHVAGYSVNETLIYLYRNNCQMTVMVNQELDVIGVAEFVTPSLTLTQSTQTEEPSTTACCHHRCHVGNDQQYN